MDEMAKFRGMVRRGPWAGSDLNGVFQELGSVSTVPGGVADDLYLTPQQTSLITRGVANGDFSEGPPDPASAIDDITNKLPGWSLSVVQGSSISAYWVADSAYPGGAYIRFDFAAGDSLDEIDLIQDAPVESSRFGLFAHWVQIARGSHSFASGATVASAQYLLADSETTTGTAATSSGWSSVLRLKPNGDATAPSDAAHLRIGFGVRRSATNASTGSLSISDVSVLEGRNRILVADESGLSTGYIYQDDEHLYIYSGGGTGAYVRVSDGYDDVVSYPRVTVPLLSADPAIPDLGSGSGGAGSFYAIDDGRPWFLYSLDGIAEKKINLGFSGCKVHKTSTQSISDATDTNLSFDTTSGATEDYDTDSYHANASPARMTVPADGYYHVDVGIEWEANSTGVRNLWLEVDGSGEYGRDRETTPSASAQEFLHISTDLYLTSGQYVQAKVRQTSGGSLNINSGNNSFLNIHRLG